MSTDAEGEELFVGQMVALLPLNLSSAPGEPPPRGRLRKVIPRSLQPPPATHRKSASKAVRPKSYAVVNDAPGHGIMMVGQSVIEVSISPLDVHTPLEATVFRVASIEGDAMRVTGVVTDPPVEPPTDADAPS